jgi:hypothetical protein
MHIIRTLSTLAVCFILAGSGFQSQAQCSNINAPETVAWVNQLIDFAISEDNACRAGAPDRDLFAANHACNVFVGRIMARRYGLRVFEDAGRFLQANEIAERLPRWPDWIDLGSAAEQSVLDAAAAAAKRGEPVVAVWANPRRQSPGHVALIGPGPLTQSGEWKGLRTPVAASFALDHAEKAFLGQPLACAFGSEKRSTTHLWQYLKTRAIH